MKITYIKPEVKNIEFSLGSPFLNLSKNSVDGDPIKDNKEGNPDEIDSRKNESGWNFDW